MALWVRNELINERWTVGWDSMSEIFWFCFSSEEELIRLEDRKDLDFFDEEETELLDRFIENIWGVKERKKERERERERERE